MLSEQGIEATCLPIVAARACVHEKQVDLAIIVTSASLRSDEDAYTLRRMMVDSNIQLITKMKQARLFLSALTHQDSANLPVLAWNEYAEPVVVQ